MVFKTINHYLNREVNSHFSILYSLFKKETIQVEQNMKIAIASGKGGTGKTFISTNLFIPCSYKERMLHWWIVMPKSLMPVHLLRGNCWNLIR